MISREDLLITHRISIEKYSYFLLAASGAAIGLAINQTKSSQLSISQFPLAVAVICWLASFLFGCLQTENYQLTLWFNALLLEVRSGTHPIIGSNLEAMEYAIRDTMARFDKASTKVKNFGAWQFRFLAAGAIFYLVWHICEMYLRTVGHG